MSSTMKCEKLDDQLDFITAMTISSNRQCLAIACKLLNDKSARIFFYDMLQIHPLKRAGKAIHDGSPTDEDDKQFISIAFSPEAKYLAALTNIKDGHVRLYEWKKDVRIIAANSWMSELNKEGKINSNVEITKVSIDPINKGQICLSGKGHFRLWRTQGDIFKPLPIISGVDQNKAYTDHAWIEGNYLVGSTEQGDLCFIYDCKQFVFEVKAFSGSVEPITCLYPFFKGILVGNNIGQLGIWERKESLNKQSEISCNGIASNLQFFKLNYRN